MKDCQFGVSPVNYSDSDPPLPQTQDENDDPEPSNSEFKERFIKVSPEECDQFLLENQNRNTKYKTKSDLKIFHDWAMETGEMRTVDQIPAEELDGL